MSLATASVAVAGQGIYVVSGALPVSRMANGSIQDATPYGNGDWLVQVVTEQSPVTVDAPVCERRARDASDPDWRVPEGFRPPLSLVQVLAGRENILERATSVLEWVQRTVTLDEQSLEPQDARSVLKRGTARCSGLANAAVAALRAAGVPAHTLSGVLVTADGPVAHRWIEAHLGSAGWVPSDPTLGLWVVTPRHIVCRQPAVGDVSVEVRSIADDDLAVLPRRGPWPSRPREGAGLVLLMAGLGRSKELQLGRIVLAGPGGARREALASGETSFSRLLPGHWVVRVEVEGKTVREFGLDLRDGESKSVSLSVSSVGEAS